jgi:gas vesicle protein
MNNFVKGLLVGIGVGLLVAPMRGEEMRKTIGERAGQLRGYLPENEQLELYRQQISGRMRDTASSLKDYAQQAAETVKTNAKTTASNLNEIAQGAASTVKRSGEDVANTTKDTANSVRANSNG